MAAYYNEHDPFAAAWLRQLIADNLIAPGEVDERSIEDVTPDDIRSFQQCHFFAGIGVWSLAARLAGIPDDAPLWSGSCPCQPFSAAGKGGGFDDERHLWPAFHYLIEQCSPAIVVGEQVAGAGGDAWLDAVSADLDATGYAFGAAETCAAGFGAPHIRSRNYWVAVADGDGHGQHGRRLDRATGEGQGGLPGGSQRFRSDLAHGNPALRLADREREGLEGLAGNGNHRHQPGWLGAVATGSVAARDDVDGLADAGGERWAGEGLLAGQGRPAASAVDARRPDQIDRPGPVNGFWRDADWLGCRDQKWRPVESGTFPLVDAGTVRNRVGLLRGAGNAITIGQAEGFLRAVIASLAETD